MSKTADLSLGVHRVVMRGDICWVVGVIDAYGAVRSVVQTFDEEPESHEYLFGVHGRRFRTDNHGTLCDGDYRDWTGDEIELATSHARQLLSRYS